MDSIKSKQWPVVCAALFLAVTAVTASCAQQDCMVADVVTPIYETEASVKGFKLAIITTGMQDKVEVVSLFPKEVTFDDCGRPQPEAYHEVVVEDDKAVEKINVENKKITLEYSDKHGTTNFSSVLAEFK
jgi:hypothetical protein